MLNVKESFDFKEELKKLLLENEYILINRKNKIFIHKNNFTRNLSGEIERLRVQNVSHKKMKYSLEKNTNFNQEKIEVSEFTPRKINVKIFFLSY